MRLGQFAGVPVELNEPIVKHMYLNLSTNCNIVQMVEMDCSHLNNNWPEPANGLTD